MSISGSPNILLIIADDLGADSVLISDRSPERRMYVITDAGGPMILGELPYLSIILRCGLYFPQAWAQPACSPTRGSIYTGTWPWRNGVGNPTNPRLDPSLVTALPDLLIPLGYSCGIYGKWHLGQAVPYLPTDHGWDRHAGTLDGTIGASYYSWNKYTSDNAYSAPTATSTYATDDTVQEAGTWIAGLPVDTPWFVTLAFHTPHSPWETPPAGTFLLPNSAAPVTRDDDFNAMSQNMDYNIGRLLGSGAGAAIDFIDPAQLSNTVILFLGDNGSATGIATEEPKTSVQEGGVRVPMIIADGASVSGEIAGSATRPNFLARNKVSRSTIHFVHAVDLYQTIAEIAGVTAGIPSPIDSVSLWPVASTGTSVAAPRAFNFSQYFTNTSLTDPSSVQRVTIRNEEFKLNYEVTTTGGVATSAWAFYKYDGGEIPGLEDGTAKDIFAAALADVQAGTVNDRATNLNALLDELILSGNYALDSFGTAWTDPR